MLADVAEGASQVTQAIGLADDKGVQADAIDKRLLLRLLQHLVEVVDDHVRERPGVAMMQHDHRDVVDLMRIGQAEQPAPAGLDPHRLIVHRPVEEAPHTDAVAVLAPSPVVGVWMRNARRHRDAEPLAIGEVLHVEGDVKRQSLALGPRVIGAVDDRGILEAAVVTQHVRTSIQDREGARSSPVGP